jgi:hypothetical protein
MRLANTVWTSINLLVFGGGKIFESNSVQPFSVSMDQSGFFCPDLSYSSSVTFGDPQWPGSFYNYDYSEPVPKLCSDEDYMQENLEEPIKTIAEGIANGTLCGGVPALGSADKPFWGDCPAYDRSGWPCGKGYYAVVFVAGGNSSVSSNFTQCAISLIQPYTQAVESKINNCLRKWGIGSGTILGVFIIAGINWAIYKCCPPKICQKKSEDSKESKSGCCSRLFGKKSPTNHRTSLLHEYSRHELN